MGVVPARQAAPVAPSPDGSPAARVLPGRDGVRGQDPQGQGGGEEGKVQDQPGTFPVQYLNIFE